PGEWSGFPIFSTSTGFDNTVRNPANPRRHPSPLHGIDPSGGAWALIEGEQPYHRRKLGKDPAGHELAGLRHLSNIDKHRALMVQVLLPAEQTIWDLVGRNPDAILLESKVASPLLSLEGETELIRMRFSDAGPDPQVHVKDQLGIHPSFGTPIFGRITTSDEAYLHPLAYIKHLRIYVGDLIGKFERFF
ncbi:MAG: hypothetical protein M3283_07690, partial [Actinomycetota bacterium]|nr:hypothetical protein [Actinomycetota bacterium]